MEEIIVNGNIRIISNEEQLSFFKIFTMNENKKSDVLFKTLDVKHIAYIKKTKCTTTHDFYVLRYINDDYKTENFCFTYQKNNKIPSWFNIEQKQMLYIIDNYESEELFNRYYQLYFLKFGINLVYIYLDEVSADIVNQFKWIILDNDTVMNDYVNTELPLDKRFGIIPKYNMQSITSSNNVYEICQMIYRLLFAPDKYVRISKISDFDDYQRYFIGSIAYVFDV